MYVPGKPSIFLFELDRGKRGRAFVVWERRDEFTGEDSPAGPFDCTWTREKASAVDALGQIVPLEVVGKRIHLSVSLTPVFIEPAR